MAKRIYSPVEIVGKLQEATTLVAEGHSVAEVARLIGVDESTFRKWQAEYGGLARVLGPMLPRLKNGRRKRPPRV
jgi:putative transposase